MKELVRNFYDFSTPKFKELEIYLNRLKVKKLTPEEIEIDFGDYGNSVVELNYWQDARYADRTIKGMKSQIEEVFTSTREDCTIGKPMVRIYNRFRTE